MRAVTLFALGLWLGSSSLHAQARPGRPVETTSQTLLRLEDGWATGLVRRDSAFFERILATGFVYSEDAKTFTRAEVLQGLFADTVTGGRNEDMKIHDFGTTAIVTGWLTLQGHGTSGTFDRRYRFTDVWMRRGGRWQMVGAHDYLVPATR
jgi:hypothetical protein